MSGAAFSEMGGDLAFAAPLAKVRFAQTLANPLRTEALRL